MKSKMKKFTSIAAMSAILATTSLSSVFASGGITTTQSRSTQVHVGILEGANKPDQINVTVPTMLAITVHADTTEGNKENAPVTYVGGSAGNGANASGTNALTFKNKSTRTTQNGLEGIPLKVTGVEVVAESNTPWSILNADVQKRTEDKFKLNLTLNGMKFVDLKQGEEKQMYFEKEGKNDPFIIPAPVIINDEASVNTANMEVKAKAGGLNKDYENEGTGKNNKGEAVTAPAAFTIEWIITSDSNSTGQPEKKAEKDK